MNPRIDSYSGFFDNGHRASTGMGEWLKARGVGKISVAGVATDYCVKFTVLDALAEGFEVELIAAACRGVDLNPGDVEHAVGEMHAAGAVIA
jgi:nicotinamidase/pyrazinamidase